MIVIPAPYNLTIYRDRDFSLVFSLKSSGQVLILTQYSARAEIRVGKDSTTLIVAFTVDIDEAAGEVTISLTDSQTVAIRQNAAYWDLVLTDPSGSRQNYVEGSVMISGTVTRAAS